VRPRQLFNQSGLTSPATLDSQAVTFKPCSTLAPGPWRTLTECPSHVPPGRRLGGTPNAFRVCDLFV